MASRKSLVTILLALAAAFAIGGCGYIYYPEDSGGPTALPSGVSGGWKAIATKVDAASGKLHVDVAIENDTGDESEMHAVAGKPARLVDGGKTTNCATVNVSTGGNRLSMGFRMTGYTGGTKAAPKTQMLFVECDGAAAPAAGAKLQIDIEFLIGIYNYYVPSAKNTATLEIPLDKPQADLVYPFDTAKPPTDLEKVDTTITAINQCQLVIKSVVRSADKLTVTWTNTNPTEYPVYVHILAPAIGKDGIMYGFYQSPHLADAPLTPAKQSAEWTTVTTVPADAKGLFLNAYVETKGEKQFFVHAIDISDK